MTRPHSMAAAWAGRIALALVLAVGVQACGGERAGPPAEAQATVDDASADSASPLELGEAQYRAGEFEASLETFTSAAEAAGEAGDSATLSVALTWQGLTYYNLGEYAEARATGEAALELKERLGMADEIPRSLNALGLLAWQESRLADALDLHERSMAAAERVEDERGVARSLNNLGLVLTDLGDLTGAVERYERAAPAFRDLGLADFEARVLTNLGALRMEIGDPAGAEQALTEAFELYALAEDPVGELNALGQLGVVRAAQGDPEAGLASLTTALEQARAMGLATEEASNLEQLANIHTDLGSTRLALDLYQEANALNESLGLTYQQGANLRAQAGLQREEGNLTLAREQLERALELHRAMGARAEELWDVLHLAEVEQAALEPDAADAWLAEAERLAGELSHPRAALDLALTRAAISEARDEQAAVLSVVGAVRPLLDQAPLDIRWRLALYEAQAHADLGVDAALPAARDAAALVDRLRGAIESDVLRNGVAQARSETYHLLVDLLLERGDVGAAFSAADASRSTATLRRIADRPDPSGAETSATVDALLDRVGQLDAAIASRYRSLYGDASDAWILREMAELEDRRASVLDQLAEAGVSFAAATGTAAASLPDPVDVAVLQANLGHDEAVVTWLETENALIAFAVRSDTVAVRRVPVSGASLSGRVRVARALIADPVRFDVEGRAVLAALHETLLGSMSAEGGVLAGATRLRIVTDGSLTYLPIAALVDPATGAYLIERHTVSAIPSAAALLALRARAGSGGGTARDWVGAGFAPTPDELPRTVAEVDDFTRRVPGRAFVGEAATEAELRRALESGAVVHAAAHGRMNARNPLFTRLQLAPGTGSAEDDGLLHVHELLQITTRSPLVFLSACETGLASSWAPGVVGGRDLSTLAQALLYGGAGTVVATLWTVEDQAAADFSQRFYDALGTEDLATADPADALAAAQRQMIRSDATRSPFYWAGYVIQGSGG